ncbi:hypothetical protein M422DRAFT_66910 [Sphaerobolus stellatus SS14]|uniref:F-box domain-containing protein n=1 Tax=Sphaerobolus stellatus (strain SS14) TaxID=990650 RepID=A0A0C9VTE5_SPHS4|nr:hypothetical protein M422DRAFT_66910 [Sphaerobolus stellatus SS14]
MLLQDLPLDILRLIFEQTTIRISSTTAHAKFFHPYESLNLSHVCRLWRTVALNYPRLWTHIHGMDTMFTAFCIFLSKAADLTLVIKRDNMRCCGMKMNPTRSYDFKLIKEILPQVSFLCFVPEVSDINSFAEVFWNSPAPRLRICHFDFTTLHEGMNRSGWGEMEKTLFSGPFPGGTPRLRYALWQRFLPSLDSPMWNDLVVLRVGSSMTGQTLSLIDWLSLLSRSPSLQELMINVEFLDDRELLKILPDHKLYMGQLQTISLSGFSMKQVKVLFDYLQFPRISSLHIYSILKTGSEDALPHLDEILTQVGEISSLIQKTKSLVIESLGGYPRVVALSDVLYFSTQFLTQTQDWPTYIFKHTPRIEDLKFGSIPNKYLKFGSMVMPEVKTLHIGSISGFPDLTSMAEDRNLPSLSIVTIGTLFKPLTAQNMGHMRLLFDKCNAPKIVVIRTAWSTGREYDALAEFCKHNKIEFQTKMEEKGRRR